MRREFPGMGESPAVNAWAVSVWSASIQRDDGPFGEEVGLAAHESGFVHVKT